MGLASGTQGVEGYFVVRRYLSKLNNVHDQSGVQLTMAQWSAARTDRINNGHVYGP